MASLQWTNKIAAHSAGGISTDIFQFADDRCELALPGLREVVLTAAAFEYEQHATDEIADYLGESVDSVRDTLPLRITALLRPERVPGTAKAEHLLGVIAEVDVEDGSRRTFDWQRSVMHSRLHAPDGGFNN